ncbi:cytochrome c [Roseovarius sp. MBR-78]|uniref:c-type cytochrome n=1 Tax=Roseovarius sp. MBR-78 TaxID=3156460 RepID=UPI003398DFBC
MPPLREILLFAALGMALPAQSAQAGDPERGERLFRDCTACHSVIDETGTARVRGGRTGPNLFGVIGRHAGSVPGFNYSPSMVAAGQHGLRWNEADFVVYVRDATAFLRDYLDDPEARGKMAYKLRNEAKAHDVWAYLERIAAP